MSTFVLGIVAVLLLFLRLSKDTMKVSGIKFELSQEPTLNPSYIPYVTGIKREAKDDGPKGVLKR